MFQEEAKYSVERSSYVSSAVEKSVFHLNSNSISDDWYNL